MSIRLSYPRTGDEPTDRVFDLVNNQVNALAAVSDGTAQNANGFTGVNLVEAVLDFGAGGDMATVTVSASWATPASKIVVSVVDDARVEEALIERIGLGVGGRAAGSFVIYAHAPDGASGQFKVHAMGV